MTAVDLVIERLEDREEGERTDPYDDATGKTVHAPIGNVSWGYGFNLVAIGCKGLFDVMERYLIATIEAQLMPYTWYRIDMVRQSVLLDIAYNAGVEGLLHYPKMLAAIEAHEWDDAALECGTSNPALKSRYAKLANILLSGVA